MNYDIYTEVTNRIITQLEQGAIPWKSPYFSKVGFPRNFSTGKPYHGINVFLLGSLRYTSPYFLTFFRPKSLAGTSGKARKVLSSSNTAPTPKRLKAQPMANPPRRSANS